MLTEDEAKETNKIKRKGSSDISHQELLSLLNYDPKTGDFTYKQHNGLKCVPGGKAGYIHAGFRSISFDYKTYTQHALAWFYVHGVWPKGKVYHLNGDKLDNRIENLAITMKRVPQKIARKIASNGERISHEELLKIASYNPETGRLLFKNSVQKETGRISGSYRVRTIKKRIYTEHVLVWFYIKKQWPEYTLIHINGDNLDNRIENLKESGIKHVVRTKLKLLSSTEAGVISHEELLTLMDYNIATGVFHWRLGQQQDAGKAHGKRVNIIIRNEIYRAEDLAWFYVYGLWPETPVTHVNNDALDNRLENLISATGSKRCLSL